MTDKEAVEGSHEELLALGGRYATLWKKQTLEGAVAKISTVEAATVLSRFLLCVLPLTMRRTSTMSEISEGWKEVAEAQKLPPRKHYTLLDLYRATTGHRKKLLYTVLLGLVRGLENPVWSLIKLPCFSILNDLPHDLTWPLARVFFYCAGLGLGTIVAYPLSVSAERRRRRNSTWCRGTARRAWPTVSRRRR